MFAGSRYQQVAALTGGIIGDICQTEWSGILEELGLNASGIRRSFQLSSAAQPDSIEVLVDDTVVDGWSYDIDTWFITFNKASIPPRGSVITAHYTIQSGVAEPTFDNGTGT